MTRKDRPRSGLKRGDGSSQPEGTLTAGGPRHWSNPYEPDPTAHLSQRSSRRLSDGPRVARTSCGRCPDTGRSAVLQQPSRGNNGVPERPATAVARPGWDGERGPPGWRLGGGEVRSSEAPRG